jgi:uncharacterized membrane protein YphA (DoxX/SURF4 family)
MPSLFPYLFTYDQAAPFILRLVLGITLAYFGYKKIQKKGKSSGSNSLVYGAIEILIAIFLIIGLFTQLAAMLNAVILIIKLGYKIRDKAFLTDGINYYVLLLAIALAVIVLGPGWFAFDLPL